MTDQTKDDIRLLRGWAADNHNCHRGIFARAADAMEDRAALETAVHILRNLLAVIHRDGGHYADQHGLEKAAKDAEKAWAEHGAEIAKLKQDAEDAQLLFGMDWQRALQESNRDPVAARAAQLEKTVGELAAMTEERDRLREAVKVLTAGLQKIDCGWPGDPGGEYRQIATETLNEADAILAGKEGGRDGVSNI